MKRKKKKIKKELNLIDFSERKSEALRNQKVKALMDFDEEYSSSTKSLAVKRSDKVNLTTRYLNRKMLMFSKVSIKSFVYDLINVLMFPNEEIKKIYAEFKVDRCYLYQNLTDTDQAGPFEIESINKANIITIALNPKEYYERLDDHSDNKKRLKRLKKSTRSMSFDSYSSRLADLNEFSKKNLKKPKKIQQKRFQIINESM